MEDLIANEGASSASPTADLSNAQRSVHSARNAAAAKASSACHTREGATEEEEGDFVEHLFTATTHDYLMFLYRIRTRLCRRKFTRFRRWAVRPRAAQSRTCSSSAADEKIAATIRVQSEEIRNRPERCRSRPGTKISTSFSQRSPGSSRSPIFSDYRNVRKGGIIAIQIEEGDRLIDAKLTNGNNEIVLITKEGMSLALHEGAVTRSGPQHGRRLGIRPEQKDHVVAIAIVDLNAHVARGRREWHRQTDTI